MARPPAELALAMLAVLASAAWYGYTARNGAPRPGGSIGLTLACIGFLMMLATEVLYTLRKRVRAFNRGPMNLWLKVHVFTGIVGPWLVLLHSAGKFNGVAGVVAGLTILMVVSGFVGRYIYTAVPRGIDGDAAGVAELEAQIARLEEELLARGVNVPAVALGPPPRGWAAVLARPFLRLWQRRQVRRALRKLRRVRGVDGARLRGLLARRYELWLQVNSLAATRRLLALWHLFHVPLGAVLFSLAFVHIAGALYYSTFLK